MDPSAPGLLRDGGVAIESGRILGVDQATRLRRRFPDANVENLGEVILLPGLINAHVHLELSDHSPGALPQEGLADWLLGLAQGAAMEPASLQRKVQVAVARGIEQCLRFGVTTVGDICRQCRVARPVLGDSPLRATSYGEILAMAQTRDLLDERLAAALAGESGGHLRIGLTPHAPYTVESDGYRRCLAICCERGLGLTTHLAESPDEAQFLAQHTGPLRRLWDRLGRWDDAVPCFDGGPIRLAKSLGLLDFPTLLAHVNYCDDQELAFLAAGRASVVWCPRTHRYFGHPPHRWRDMLGAGINVAVGTDGCASSPDLNLVDDLRCIHEQSPEVDAQEIWSLVMWRAAAALGMKEVGSLSANKFADVVAFPARGADPLHAILEQPLFPTALWIDGRKIDDKLKERGSV
jgi:cytosine/adenosine deaminase-related metal-dependent hydrolase